MMWLTDGLTYLRTDGRTDGRHAIIRPKFHFGRMKSVVFHVLKSLCALGICDKGCQN